MADETIDLDPDNPDDGGSEPEPAPEVPPKRGRGRPKGSKTRSRSGSSTRRTTTSLEKRLEDAIAAAAELLERTKGDTELAGVMKRDARAMSQTLGRLAGVNETAALAVKWIADCVEPIRAFGPTVAVLWGRWFAARPEPTADEAAPWIEDEAPAPAPEPEVPVDDGIARPWFQS